MKITDSLPLSRSLGGDKNILKNQFYTCDLYKLVTFLLNLNGEKFRNKKIKIYNCNNYCNYSCIKIKGREKD